MSHPHNHISAEPHGPNGHVADLVDDYLHDLLDPARAAQVERHCKACPACQEALADARRRLAALRAAPSAEAPEQLVQNTIRKVDDHRKARTRRWRRFILITSGALAACALLLLGLNLYYYNLHATPYDLVVLGQRELLAQTNGSLRVLVRDAKTLAPLANVPVTVRLVDKAHNQTAELAQFTTDADGSGEPRFAVPDWADGACELRVVASTPGRPESNVLPVTLKRSFKVMLSTDKPVYQPGQTIHARSLALRRPDLRPVADQPATFSLTDPKGNIVFKEEGKTSKYGITAADCALDPDITEGPYVVLCKTGDVESRLSVDVKKYVLPKFKVMVKPDKPFYIPHDTIKIAVQADYFFGQPVADADVTVDITDDLPGMAPDHRTGRTDAKGAASFKGLKNPADAPPWLAAQFPNPAHVHFHVTVTDPAGQKQSTSAESAISDLPAHIDVIPEAGELVAGVPNTVYVLVSRLDGRPAGRAHVKLTNLTNNKGPLDKAVEYEADADDNGAASIILIPSGQITVGGESQMSVEIAASDDNDKAIARRDVMIPVGPANDFLVRTDKAVYRGGDTMMVTAVGGPGPVFVDFIQEGQTLLTETLDVGNGPAEKAVDLPADLSGTVQVVGYRLDAKGYPVRKTRVVYVEPADQIHIAATLDPGKQAYKPGERPTLRLKLTGKDGKPSPGAVSLAGVDEAVFSVLAQRPGTEQAFYTLQENLMAPVFKLHPWSPDDAGSQRYQQALFAAASRSDQVSPNQNMGGPAVPAEKKPIAAQAVPPLIDEITPTSAPAETHSLVAQTYQTKVQQTESLRADRLNSVRWGWVGLVIAVIFAGLAAFLLFGQSSVLVKSLVLGYVVIPFVMVLAVLVLAPHIAPQTQWGLAGGKAAPAGMATRTEGLGSDWGAPEEPNAPATAFSSKLADTSRLAVQPDAAGAAARPRVRQMFPETLLWRPEIITDDDGNASLPLELADSIMTWRLSASAVSGDGRLGAMQMPVKVFQDFFVDLNLPVSLTRGDEAGVPVVVYNYLDKPQTVTLTLADADWFVRQGDAEQRLELAPNEVRSVRYRIKVRKVGDWTLTVAAKGAADADAVKRPIQVLPDGYPVEQTASGTLDKPASLDLNLPADHIPGSAKAFVKIYPSTFSQLVEGLDNVFRMPYGCFEQTSSTTYPNILALDYLQRTGKSNPAVEAKAYAYIRAGAQRLFSFEVPGGGFDWFGHPPANRALTAYGLMEFRDMDRVTPVDPRVINRTRTWLLSQRRPDGSWDPETHKMHDDAVGGRTSEDERLAETAYVGWAVFSDPYAIEQATTTFSYLKRRNPDDISDPHTLALVCNALLAVDEHNADAVPYLDQLDKQKRFTDDGRFAWWEQPAGRTTLFYGAGRGGNVETTALAALALLRSGRHPDTAHKALAWITSQKDPNGTWYSTQATVLALKALLAGTGKPQAADERVVEIKLGDEVVQTVRIPPDQSDVMQSVNVTPFLKLGKQTLTVSEAHGGAIGFQTTFRYHMAGAAPDERRAPLDVELSYDRTELAVGEEVRATAQVVNKTGGAAPMVMMELPVPAGFAASADEFAALVKPGGRVAKYQMRPQGVLLYLTGLDAGESLKVTYRLRATMPVKALAAGARAYEYYDPDKQGSSAGTRLTVAARD